jgi:hypothetical protein
MVLIYLHFVVPSSGTLSFVIASCFLNILTLFVIIHIYLPVAFVALITFFCLGL